LYNHIALGFQPSLIFASEDGANPNEILNQQLRRGKSGGEKSQLQIDIAWCFDIQKLFCNLLLQQIAAFTIVLQKIAEKVF
jgi:hypothetical protein